ncbi:lipocalin family protein [Arcobacter sp. KX21116]|uniref:lipocalin family protein n=1 Tax=Arcobacter iocasae TaxID=2906515 RepID=UPI0035D496EF
MRVIFMLLFFFLSLYSKTPQSVNFVDPKLFSGTWFEIARTYNYFEKNCLAPTVEYKLLDSNEFKVFNRCYDKYDTQNIIQYEGKAVPKEKDSMSKIDMTYFLIFTSEYRIIYLNDYQTAVMASSDLENIWIMSKTKNIKKDELNKILKFLDSFMDTSKLIYSNHS